MHSHCGAYQLTHQHLPFSVRVDGYPHEVVCSVARERGFDLGLVLGDDQSSGPLAVGPFTANVPTQRRPLRDRLAAYPGSLKKQQPPLALSLGNTSSLALTLHDSGKSYVSLIEASGSSVSTLELSEALSASLSHALASCDLLPVHACAFSWAGRGFLVVGPSRSGKSTLAAAILKIGGRLCSDDAVILSRRELGRLEATWFRRSLLFRTSTEGALPKEILLRTRKVWDQVANENRLRLDRERIPTLVTNTIEPTVMWLLEPHYNRRKSTVSRATQAEALACLLAESLPIYAMAGQSSETSRAWIRTLVALVASMPAMRIETARDFFDVPEPVVLDWLKLGIEDRERTQTRSRAHPAG